MCEWKNRKDTEMLQQWIFCCHWNVTAVNFLLPVTRKWSWLLHKCTVCLGKKADL